MIGAEGIKFGFGVHQWDVPIARMTQFRKVSIALLEYQDMISELNKPL